MDAHPAGCEPPGRRHAVDRTGTLTIDDRAVPGGLGGGGLIIGKGGAGAMGDPGRPPPATSSWWAFPRGREGAAWCGRPHPVVSAHCPSATTTTTRDQGSETARHQRQGRRHREPGVLFAHPHSPWEGAANENTNRHRGPLPAQRHPHHQPPTPARAPSPTNRATAPAPPSTTPPHKRHSPNSLPPPLDTTLHPHSTLKSPYSGCTCKV